MLQSSELDGSPEQNGAENVSFEVKERKDQLIGTTDKVK